MKFNVIKSQKEFELELRRLKVKEGIEVNIKDRVLNIVRYNNGFTIWWGESHGIDAVDVYDIIDKLEMLTAFVVGQNGYESYLTKENVAYSK